MPSFEKPRLRRTTSTVIAIGLLIFLLFHLCDDYYYYYYVPLYWQAAQLKGDRLWDAEPIEPWWEWNVTSDAHNLLLTHRHCQQAFNGLFKPTDQSVRRHRAPYSKIHLSDLDKVSGMKGVVRAMIYDQQLYVISTGGSISSDALVVLSQIYRALVTSPEEVADIEFAFSTDERPAHYPRTGPTTKMWSLARAPSDRTTWLMPDFTPFRWPDSASVETFHDVRRKAEAIDNDLAWDQKSSRLLWRGGMTGVSQHEHFLDATSGASWADVQTTSRHHHLDTSTHCRSKYLAHTETSTSNGRLKYLQLCHSVILIPAPAKWDTYTTHLLEPSGPGQNHLPVRDDWSDVDAKIRHLREWETLGERIARNSAATFRERVLTPAAEACTWRRLFRGWRDALGFEVEFSEDDDQGGKRERGVLFEQYLAERIHGRE